VGIGCVEYLLTSNIFKTILKILIFMKNILAILFFLIVQLSQEQEPMSEKFTDKTQSQITCPHCGSDHTIKNGSTHNAKSKRLCKNCGRQFVINPNKQSIDLNIKLLIDKLLLERISLRAIARVTGVSYSWLQNYVNHKLSRIPRQVKVSVKSKGKLTIECDEMWSFVGSKGYKVYIWLAIDRDTREIIGCYLGDRTRQSARKLWASLPPVYRQCAVAYTDFWQAYVTVIPSMRHHAVGKETGLTNHIERLNNTFRQRISRLVRKSLSFSKNLDNHIGAVWYFIHDYNSRIATV
jgi:insertion element IS1 protein InsB